MSSQSSSSHIWMWELDYKEGWAPKNWCFLTVVLEKTLESPLNCREIKPVNPKGDQSWISIGRTDAEAETPILWPPDAKKWLIGKDLDARKDWRREKGMTGWDGWMVSPTRWTWIWVNFGSWWFHPAIHPLLSPSPPAFNLSQHQHLFKWVSSLHQVAKVLEL